MSSDQKVQMEFPCDFAIKVMGKQSAQFEEHVLSLLHKHFDKADILAVQHRDSSGANYLSLTVTVRATNRAQLDAAYTELSASQHVLMTL